MLTSENYFFYFFWFAQSTVVHVVDNNNNSSLYPHTKDLFSILTLMHYCHTLYKRFKKPQWHHPLVFKSILNHQCWVFCLFVLFVCCCLGYSSWHRFGLHKLIYKHLSVSAIKYNQGFTMKEINIVITIFRICWPSFLMCTRSQRVIPPCPCHLRSLYSAIGTMNMSSPLWTHQPSLPLLMSCGCLRMRVTAVLKRGKTKFDTAQIKSPSLHPWIS